MWNTISSWILFYGFNFGSYFCNCNLKLRIPLVDSDHIIGLGVSEITGPIPGSSTILNVD